MRRRVEIARGLVHEPQDLLPRRADHRPRSRLARRRLGNDQDSIKEERDLTVLLTTHYMDEADRLCDRIAIVDHGKLVALDSPLKLKASIPSQNTIEVSFSERAGGLDRAPQGAAARAVGHQRGSHLPHRHLRRSGHDDGAGRRRPKRGRDRAVAVGQEHHARRCVRALHRARPARRAAGSGAAPVRTDLRR